MNADGTLQRWACTGTSSMKWTVDPNRSPGCTRSSRRSVAGHGRAEWIGRDGAAVQIYRCTGFGNPAQVWSFSAV
ncbi:hypothetical protein V2I01_33930 [Micromonospora sp. BRA006-A]|nr:hypothetical protein [Micromonospora sp. BRA006-A]